MAADKSLSAVRRPCPAVTGCARYLRGAVPGLRPMNRPPVSVGSLLATSKSRLRQNRGVEEQRPPRASALKRIALAALLTIVGLNVWTGGPLLALWVGSRVQGEGSPTMGAVFVVVVV